MWYLLIIPGILIYVLIARLVYNFALRSHPFYKRDYNGEYIWEDMVETDAKFTGIFWIWNVPWWGLRWFCRKIFRPIASLADYINGRKGK